MLLFIYCSILSDRDKIGRTRRTHFLQGNSVIISQVIERRLNPLCFCGVQSNMAVSECLPAPSGSQHSKSDNNKLSTLWLTLKNTHKRMKLSSYLGKPANELTSEARLSRVGLCRGRRVCFLKLTLTAIED